MVEGVLKIVSRQLEFGEKEDWKKCGVSWNKK
jgi:hypothetical protein